MMAIRKTVASVIGFIALNGVAYAAETVTYSYDALGRLVASSTSGGANNGVNTGIAFDPAGNRITYAVSGGAALRAPSLKAKAVETSTSKVAPPYYFSELTLRTALSRVATVVIGGGGYPFYERQGIHHVFYARTISDVISHNDRSLRPFFIFNLQLPRCSTGGALRNFQAG